MASEIRGISLRLDAATLAALDEAVEEERRARPGATITRSELVRTWIIERLRQRPGTPGVAKRRKGTKSEKVAR